MRMRVLCAAEAGGDGGVSGASGAQDVYGGGGADAPDAPDDPEAGEAAGAVDADANVEEGEEVKMDRIHFETGVSTFRRLMGSGERYRVPPFQRDYAWGEDEWEDLWWDVCGVLDAAANGGGAAVEGHYMGFLVLKADGAQDFDIIDGQQRLTTISVLVLAALAVLRELVESEVDAAANAKRMDELRAAFIGVFDSVNLATDSKLQLNRYSDAFYRNYLVPLDKLPKRGLNDAERRLGGAFEWFRDKMRARVADVADAGAAVARFVEAVADNLLFTAIVVTDELNAFRVFETLNARGVNLSATDLLKNHLMSLMTPAALDSSAPGSSVPLPLEERWERIFRALGDGTVFPEYLRVFWNSRHELVRENRLFKVVRGDVGTAAAARDLLRGLDAEVEVFAALRDPRDERWGPGEREALEVLRLFGDGACLSMLLACYRAFFERRRDDFVAIAQAAVVASFRNGIIGGRVTHAMESLSNAIAVRVAAGEYDSRGAVMAALREGSVGDEEFIAAFAEKSLDGYGRGRKIARYVLFELERHYCGRAKFDREDGRWTIEYVLPENAGPEWEACVTEAQQARWVYRLGNMTLLKARHGREVENAVYAVKRAVYSESDFMITRAIGERCDEWNEAKIAARQGYIARAAAEIWRLSD